MGLLRTDSDSKQAKNLCEAADGDSVTTRKLTTSSRTFTRPSYAKDKEIISYLLEDEQPHYFFHNMGDEPKRHQESVKKSPLSSLFTLFSANIANSVIITDLRIMFFNPKNKQERAEAIFYDDISGVETSEGYISSRLTIQTTDYNYSFWAPKAFQTGLQEPSYDFKEVKSAATYIEKQLKNKKEQATSEQKSKQVGELPLIWGEVGESDTTDGSKVEERSSIQKTPEQETSDGYEKRREERKQKIQKDISSIRSKLSEVDSLATDAKFQRARIRLDDIESRITEVRQEVSQEGFDTLETEIQQLERKCKNRLSKSHVLSQLREMDPYEFEELVAKIWEKQGWDAEVTSGSSDRGVDVVATKEDALEKRRHLIQVKRHGENSKVGSKDIQRYASLYQRDEQVDKVFVVTSNELTEEAKTVAERRDVSTVNGDELYEMLTETY